MEEHHHFDVWKSRINELISLSKRTQRRLGYYKKAVAQKSPLKAVGAVELPAPLGSSGSCQLPWAVAVEGAASSRRSGSSSRYRL